MELLDRVDQMTKAAHRAFESVSPQPMNRARLLHAIEINDGGSQSELVSATGIDRSTMTTMLMTMERDGLVRRSRSKRDARVVNVTLTPTGRRALRSCEAAYAKTKGEIAFAIGVSGKAA